MTFRGGRVERCRQCGNALPYHDESCSAPVHTFPVNDLVDHDTDGGDCPCGPTTVPAPRGDGTIGWQVMHHSLDGREASEESP